MSLCCAVYTSDIKSKHEVFLHFFDLSCYVVIPQCEKRLANNKPVALGFCIELEFNSVSFCGGRKTR